MDDANKEVGGDATIRMTDSERRPLPDPASSKLLVDTVLDGRYLIIRELGRGGFGSVYLASDEKLMSSRVVVKVLLDTQLDNEWSVTKFRQEIEALTRIDHPGVVRVLDTGVLPSGDPYIVMKHVDGVTLRERITAEGMALDRVAKLIKQIGSALAAVHENGIVHRDLKPENIMLQSLTGGDEQVTIIDFGVAKIKDSLIAGSTIGNNAIGTVLYMSPEQFRGEMVTAASDVYSLGIIAYEMVTGRCPFNYERLSEIGEMQRAGVRIKPRALRPSLPLRTQNLILQALSFRPQARFRDAREFADKLEESLLGDRNSRTAPLRPNGLKESLSSRLTELGFAARNHKMVVVGVAVILLAVISAAILWTRFRGSATDGANGSMSNLTVDSVAVLPFGIKGMSADSEYISDGITETLIDELSQLPSLKRVIARASVFRFKDRSVDPQVVGRDLNVAAVLSGEITRQGDDFTIHAELVATRDARHIWGERYTLKMSEVLAKQKEISSKIVTSLQLRLADQQKPRSKETTQNNDAYLLYMKGRYFWNKATPESLKTALEYFQQAIDKDPNYALAYTGLADCYNQISDVAPTETMPKAKAAALKALAIDNGLAEAHTSLGLVLLRYEWNWKSAGEEFQRAVELNPNYATAHRWYALYLLANQRFDESLVERRRSQELDPFSWPISQGLGTYFLFTRNYDAAIAEYRKTLELEPKAPIHDYIRLAYQQKGMFTEAFQEAEKEFVASGFSNEQLAEVKRAFEVSGYPGLMAKELEFEKERSKGAYRSFLRLARICAVLGLKDESFAWLGKAYDAHEDGLIWLRVDPRYDNLRSDPRFSELVQRVSSHS